MGPPPLPRRPEQESQSIILQVGNIGIMQYYKNNFGTILYLSFIKQLF